MEYIEMCGHQAASSPHSMVASTLLTTTCSQGAIRVCPQRNGSGKIVNRDPRSLQLKHPVRTWWTSTVLLPLTLIFVGLPMMFTSALRPCWDSQSQLSKWIVPIFPSQTANLSVNSRQPPETTWQPKRSAQTVTPFSLDLASSGQGRSLGPASKTTCIRPI